MRRLSVPLTAAAVLLVTVALQGCTAPDTAPVAPDCNKGVDVSRRSSPTPSSTYTFELLPTFVGISSTESELGWKPLQSKSDLYELDLNTSRVSDAYGPLKSLRLDYHDVDSDSLVSFVQGDECDLIDGSFEPGLQDPLPTEEKVRGQIAKIWEIPEEGGIGVITFPTGQIVNKTRVYAEVIAESLEAARAFVATVD